MELTVILGVGLLLALAAFLPAMVIKILCDERLKEERADFRARIEKLEADSPEARFTIGEDGRIVSFNRAAEQLFGYASSEVIGEHVSLLLPTAGENAGGGLGLNRLHAAPRVENGVGVEVAALRKDGTSALLELVLKEQRIEDKRVFRAMVRDLSERRWAGRRTGENQVLEGLLESVGVPLAVLDREGKFVRCNAALTSLVQHRASEIEGRFYWEVLLNPSEWGRAKLSVAQVIATGETERSQLLWRTREGEQIPMAVVMTAIRAKNPPPQYAVMVAFALSELTPTEATSSPNMQAVEQLAGGIARQFNDLLTSINGYSELLLGSSQLPEQARKDVQEIKRAGDRAAALTQQLLVFSGKQPMNPTVFNLNELISQMTPGLKMLLGDQIQLSSILDLSSPSGPTVEADPRWLEQVILNLAVNARDAMPGGGKLTLETCIQDLDAPTARRMAKLPPGKYVLLTVTDSGWGMDAATQARAFEPFFRSGRSQGMGLGLSTVYGVVKQVGGNVVLQSVPGSGTSIRIFLPYCESRVATQNETTKGLFLVRGAGK
ncbi:MAG: PAS domain S-box protein [Bryobacteraceae bacterium]|nr:PAS domain S-box protein [Bryobacteraceae bacterium]MDW8379679.1 PAS domain S-box protein [Bryobacterales bacterium]